MSLKTSIILCTYNEEKYIEKIIAELEKKQLEAKILEKQLQERQINLKIKESKIISKQNDIDNVIV